MEDAAHRISRLRFRLRAGRRDTATAASRRLQQEFEARLLPVLQAAFDRIAPPGRVLHLDRLDLDLGRVDPADPGFAEALALSLAQSLDKALDEALARPLTSAALAQKALVATRGAPLQRHDPPPSDPAADLLAFLATGRLPWPAPGAALASLIDSLATLGEVGLARLMARLLPVLAAADPARRFLTQLPYSAQARLVFALAGWPPAAILALPPERFLTTAEVSALAPLLTRLAAQPGSRPAAQALAAALIAPAPPPPPDPPAANPETTPARPTEPRAAPDPTTDTTAALPVTAAGAVLLHPFLAPFLASLGATLNNAFADRAAQERGVLLGQFLATGETAPAEPDCLLMKLLCGLPLDAPLPRATPIGPAERAEADQALTAVIHHWGRLGSTTPAGLREGFLLRPGLLRMADKGPVLTVERRGIDLLLDHLPWAISRVKTPFMDNLLAVAWT